MDNVQQQERTIFLKAIEFESPEDLAAYLDEACGETGPLRTSVEALLAANRQTGDVFARSAVGPRPSVIEAPGIKAPLASATIPVIDPFAEACGCAAGANTRWQQTINPNRHTKEYCCSLRLVTVGPLKTRSNQDICLGNQTLITERVECVNPFLGALELC